MDTLVDGFLEQSRSNIVGEPGRFIKVENHEAVRVGDLEENSEALRFV